MLRWLTAGESHGQALVAILEGMPAGVAITTAEVAAALARRRLGYGRGSRMTFEQDAVTLLGGVRHGRTLGGPVAITIGNTEWPKWDEVMAADPVDDAVLQGLARNAPLTRPRPGHADLVGMQKYGFDEARPVLERSSARETAARVALGAVAGAFLDQALDVGNSSLDHFDVVKQGILYRSGQLNADLFSAPNDFRLNVESSMLPSALAPFASGYSSASFRCWTWRLRLT